MKRQRRNPAYPPLDVEHALDFSVPSTQGRGVESSSKADQYSLPPGSGQGGPMEMGTSSQWGWLRRQARWRRR